MILKNMLFSTRVLMEKNFKNQGRGKKAFSKSQLLRNHYTSIYLFALQNKILRFEKN